MGGLFPHTALLVVGRGGWRVVFPSGRLMSGLWNVENKPDWGPCSFFQREYSQGGRPRSIPHTQPWGKGRLTELPPNPTLLKCSLFSKTTIMSIGGPAPLLARQRNQQYVTYVKCLSEKTKWITFVFFSMENAIFSDRFDIKSYFKNLSSKKGLIFIQ